MNGTQLVTVTSQVFDRVDGKIGWAVIATFAPGPTGPVCIEYRVRQVKRETASQVRTMAQTLAAMEAGAGDGWPSDGVFAAKGIPAYVFDDASQAHLLAKARAKMKRKPESVSETAKALLSGRERKPGRPPTLPMVDILGILAAVEDGYREGKTRKEIAESLHYSDSFVRDRLGWAKRHQPPLWAGGRQGEKYGQLTPEGRELLARLEKEL